eukprot:Nitzschia sp. Nitz4//scaffold3_size479765//214112//215309//NITZ4_000090-RA/size479765-augustus-gene-1.566-mRNA-1//1//CDS//3329550728//7575//frame0
MSDIPQQRIETVEDAPQYRSVMMAGPLSAPPMPRSFAQMRPMKASVAPLATKASNPTVPAAVWSVAELPSLPAAYFLERTNVYVDGNAQDVANKICETLRQQSIAAHADADDKNLLLAETNDAVKLAIRLFADQGKIVVEVQRKCGCSYQFREAARSLLRSAKGGNVPTRKRSFPIPTSLPKLSTEAKQQRVECGLEVAKQQLESTMVDSQLFGMESLEQLTKCEGRCSAAQRILKEPFVHKVLHSAQADVADASGMDHSRLMKRRALSVLANALCALSEENQLESVLSSTPDLKSSALVASLVNALKEAAAMPHEATQAARCIHNLMIAQEVEGMLMEMDALEVVCKACGTGACQSAFLESECQALRQKMGSL